MPTKSGWSRAQLLIAFYLYCRMPFGKMHRGNPQLIRMSAAIHRTPSALAMKLTNIASLDPAITDTGRKGLAGASATDRAMWEEMQADWESFTIEAQTAVSQLVNSDDCIDVENEDTSEEFVSYEGADKVASKIVRLRQSFFRSAVLSAYHYRCCITGMAIPKLLVASHIVPWHADKANRLNPRNGLCLSMLHDKAFDIGIICLTDDLTVRVSKRYPGDTNPFFRDALLAYDGKPINLPEKFRPNLDFLAYHREHVFGG